ncbi:WYL domain-containing protein [Streptomyces sp. NBC_00335]|uniref:helix-turn-helix transcriptional regulator n=1 Tax=unclassified Streptomyces TaxID=2593676 RepID=UPI002258FCC3|nr:MULTISPECIES: WYL domain-containing protein [unclassified Streptomyces]MCX5409105.1 WYL domain-containing protein [Streptomyces sp. NBC_00086]
MRADRLLSLLLLLQNRGRMTAPELAAELEVSVRTVYRDVEALGASGIPVHADRGPAGGFRLVDGYRTRLTGLTDAQAGSLFLAGAPGPARDLGLGADLTAAQLKLQAALPAELAGRARRIQQRFHLDAPAWFRDADPVPHLAQIAEAVWEQRILSTHYRRWSGAVHRALWPLGLVLKGGIWYLVARAAGPVAVEPGEAGTAPVLTPVLAPVPAPAPEETGSSVRTYRVGRFLAVESSGEHFERPDGFELAAYWEESARRLEAATRRSTAVVRISPRARRLLPMWFGAAGVRALATAGPPDAEDWEVVELAVESGSVAVGDLLRLGADAEVLGPPELRRALADAVAELAGRYR